MISQSKSGKFLFVKIIVNVISISMNMKQLVKNDFIQIIGRQGTVQFLRSTYHAQWTRRTFV